ncbi:MAG: hypothetical protein ACP5TZ_05260 [Nitrososphaeria archaeon]
MWHELAGIVQIYANETNDAAEGAIASIKQETSCRRTQTGDSGM